MSWSMNRRNWMQQASLIALAPTIPHFLRTSLRAAETDSKGRILVVIQLSGGNDGINTVVPFADEGYAKARKELRIPNDRLIKVNDQVGLHPSFKSVGGLLDEGRLAIIQGVGYPNPNRSHDVSMAIWQTARMDAEDHESFGWIGRAMDTRPVERQSAPQMMLVGDQSPPATIISRKSSFVAMDRLTDLQRTSKSGSSTAEKKSDTASDDLTAFVQRTTLDAYATSDLLADIAAKGKNSAAGYPSTQLARRLEMIAHLIKADFGTSVYYAIQSGYDTHSVQLQVHNNLLSELSLALKTFLNDLKSASLDDRVVVLCFSEFGRRVEENASMGTDHGTSGPVLVAGSPIKSGLYGATPSLTDLEDGDLKRSVDFRQVYATLLERWLDVNPKAVLGETYEPLAFL